MQGELQQWTGYWMYGSYKGPTDLQLFVAYDHQVLGSGEDEVGKFTIEGEERDENLNFTKHYVNAHIVNYEGKRVNKERIKGCWSLPVDTIDDWSRGQFFLKKVAIDEEHQGSFLRLNVIDWLEKISGLNTLRNWKGFYEQDDENHDMETCFVFTPSGKIHGKGNDSIGFYTWCGNLSSHEDGTKKVNLIKQYFGRHAVCYNGEMYEPEPGELVMEGTWNISFCCGAFRLQMACLSSGQVQRQWTFGQVQQWTGYWIQESRKGPMDLELFITYDHQVLGSGEDEVGKFTIEGQELATNLNFTKHYVNAHTVNYEGKRVREDRIEGSWSLSVDIVNDWSKGQFLLEKIAIDEEHQGSSLHPDVIYWLQKVSCLNRLRDWKGFYEQYDENHDMETSFVFTPSGRVHGKGNDSIGLYTWCGNFNRREDGIKKVSLVKQYFEQHAVCYNGELHESEPGELVMEGTWKINDDSSGAFRLQMAC